MNDEYNKYNRSKKAPTFNIVNGSVVKDRDN